MFVELAPTAVRFEERDERVLVGTDAVHVRLDATKTSDLNWSLPKTSERIVWELVFDKDRVDPSYGALMRSAVEQFSRSVYPHYESQSVCCLLGRMEDRALSHETVGVYSRMLLNAAAELPLELPGACAFTQTHRLTPLDQAELFSPVHFEHLGVFYSPEYGIPSYGLEGAGIAMSFASLVSPPKRAILLPEQDSGLSDETYFMLVDQLQDPFRVIPERHAVEMWDELEELIFFEGYLSPVGKRVLQGFAASGGLTTPHVRINR